MPNYAMESDMNCSTYTMRESIMVNETNCYNHPVSDTSPYDENDDNRSNSNNNNSYDDCYSL